MLAEKSLAGCQSMREFALYYFERCGMAIVPCYPHDKSPSILDWNKHPLVSFEDIDLFYQCNENYNIGIHPLKSGLVCIDVDNKPDKIITHGPFKGHKRDGIASFKEMLKRGLLFPNTLCAKSPAGGYKQFYKAPIGIDLTDCKDVIAPGVELLCSSHQAVIPPSFHPLGQRYGWVWSPERVPDVALPMSDEFILSLRARGVASDQ